MHPDIISELRNDPVRLAKVLWPDVRLYDKQREILFSVWENDETFVVAGNMLGKDFTAGLTVLMFFLTRTPCRVVTTSADYAQLESVLWGEIRRFIQTSTIPLDNAQEGPLLVNHLHIKRIISPGTKDARTCPLSYVIARVSAKGEGMLGHHIADVGDGIPRTLYVADEGSGIEDVSYERADTWAKRKLIIGNPYPGAPGCTFFEKGCKGGDITTEQAMGKKTPIEVEDTEEE